MSSKPDGRFIGNLVTRKTNARTDQAEPPSRSRVSGAARGLAGLEQGAVLCNTAPNTYGSDGDSLSDGPGDRNDGFRVIRLAVDSLYLSYPGQLAETVEKSLKAAKLDAQSAESFVQAQATFYSDGHLFHVSAKGSSFFPYVLVDGRFRIQAASSKAKQLPLAYVQIASDFLTHVGVDEAVRQLDAVISDLGQREGQPKVARIDLCVDFQSDINMESWDRSAWITRGGSVNAYSVDGKFSGWSIGLGGIIGGRLYDKTLEIKSSGKVYMHDVWQAAGYDPERPVWRLEFELKREILKQYGLNSLESVLKAKGALWQYATAQWLRLAVPQRDDSNRGRWPTHSLWERLAAVDWNTPPVTLQSRFVGTDVPSEKYLCNAGLNAILGFMLREQIQDYDEGEERYLRRMRSFHYRKAEQEGAPFYRYVSDRLLSKARQYKVVMPVQEPDWDALEAEQLAEAAERYRRESNGG